MSIIPENPINAPNTTIEVGSIQISVSVAPDQSRLTVNVRLYDGYNTMINLPRPLAPMNITEINNMLVAISTVLQEATVPYLDRVLGIGTPTIG